jgi:E3 ubiquitin-protein ligase RAD18
MKEAAINPHLDRGCVDPPMDMPRVTKSLGKSGKQPLLHTPTPLNKPETRPERLAQPNYQFIKDGAMKKKLTDMGLSAMGNRQLLERRYAEWVTLWNANCDATRPKTKAELKKELDTWERAQGKPSSSQGSQIKDKDFDGKGWSTTHDADFKSLIAKARAKVPPKSEPPNASSEG